MRSYLHKTPFLLRFFYPYRSWKINDKEDTIFLTFDDGPDSEITPYVLDQLARNGAKATFFVIGANVIKHPKLLERMISEGHQIANHGFRHLNGWTTSFEKYIDDFSECESILTEFGVNTEKLFRPPYGRIASKQSRFISRTHKIIMWDLLSGDFDSRLDHGLARKSLLRANGGSIVLFHDNNKFIENVKVLLPWFLGEFRSNGYNFETLGSFCK